MSELDHAAYFRRLQDDVFAATEHVGGAWNIEEQHVAPALGLMAHVIETNHRARRDKPLTIGRLSYDILGTFDLSPVEIEQTVLRSGRTIELVEARLLQKGRAAVLLRAWFAESYDTASLMQTNFASLPPPQDMPVWDASSLWPGGFIASLEMRRHLERPGRGRGWLRSPLSLIAGETVSPTAATLGLVDAANGIATLASPHEVAFPNLDLTVHLFRPPEGGWLGVEAAVSFGAAGAGVTSSILHDEAGAFGCMAQWLTVRPIAVG